MLLKVGGGGICVSKDGRIGTPVLIHRQKLLLWQNG